MRFKDLFNMPSPLLRLLFEQTYDSETKARIALLLKERASIEQPFYRVCYLVLSDYDDERRLGEAILVRQALTKEELLVLPTIQEVLARLSIESICLLATDAKSNALKQLASEVILKRMMQDDSSEDHLEEAWFLATQAADADLKREALSYTISLLDDYGAVDFLKDQEDNAYFEKRKDEENGKKYKRGRKVK